MDYSWNEDNQSWDLTDSKHNKIYLSKTYDSFIIGDVAMPKDGTLIEINYKNTLQMLSEIALYHGDIAMPKNYETLLKFNKN